MGSFAGTGRYQVLGALGEGGMGVVYKVRDRQSGELRALKTVANLDPDQVLRLKDEFRAAVDLRHGNLVRLGELVEDDGAWFFTMELVDGVSFTEWVRGPQVGEPPSDPDAPTVQDVRRTSTVARAPIEGGFDEARLRAAMAQLAMALVALHQKDRIHRDIKPSNVMVTGEGRVVVLDFGLTTRRERKVDDPIAGTIEYMAPEQVLGEAVGPGSDWYSVGVLLYECLTGNVPFDGEPMTILHAKSMQEAPAPSRRVGGIPADLEALCLGLLERDPRRRLGGDDVLARLEPARPSEPARVEFVGRRRELELVADALARSRRAGAVTVLLEGESGIGKSSIAREAAAAIERDDESAVVLRGRCHDRESLPFRAFDGVVDDLSRVLKRRSAAELDTLVPARPAELARLFPVLARVEAFAHAGEPGPVATPREARARGFEQLRELLAALARRGPLVVLVDDLQWIDADSIDLLVHLLAEPDSPSLLLLGTMRPGAEGLADRVATRGIAAPVVVRVGALDDADARELARRALAAAQVAGRPEALAVDAGGHPGYIRELARAVQSENGSTPAAALEELLRARIATLPAPQQRLLAASCIANGPLPVELLAAAAGIEDESVAAHVAALRDHDLVSVGRARGPDLVEPYHDRVRAAELAALPPDEARRVHKRLAVALEARPDASLEDLHHHWAEAGRRGHAATLANRAAEAAAARLQFHRAAELYRAAIELGEPLKPATRATLQIRLGNALGLAGRGTEAADQLLAAADVVEPELAASLRRTAAEQLMASGEYTRGMDVLRAVLAEAGYSYPRGRLGTLTALLASRARLYLRGLEPRAVDGPPSPPVARAIEAALAASRSLGMVDLIRGSYYQARFLRLALDAGDESHLAVGYALEACYVAAAGAARHADAMAICARAEEAARKDGTPERVATVQLGRAVIAFMAGRFVESLVAADEAAAVAATTPGAAWDLRTARIVAGWSCWFSGQLRQLALRVRSHLRESDASSDRYSSMQLRLGVNNAAWLVIDDAGGALRAVEDARASWPVEDIQNLQYYGCIARVNALLYAGDDGEALATVERAWPLVERSLFLRVPFTHVAMREVRARAALGVAAGTRDHRRRARSLAAARADASGIRRIRQPWCDASAALIDAGVAFVEGDRSAARRWLVAAAEDERGLRLVAAAARLALCEIDGTDPVVARGVYRADGVVKPERLARLFCPPFFATLSG